MLPKSRSKAAKWGEEDRVLKPAFSRTRIGYR